MIIVGGDCLIDVIQTSDAGKPLNFAGALGGSSYNTARALGRQEVDTGFLTPMSNDNLGQLLSSGLKDESVALLGHSTDAPTSLAMVSVNDGQPTYQFYREHTAEREVNVASLTAAMPQGAKAFHLASLAIIEGDDADAWAEFFIAQHNNGVFTSLDPNIRALAINDREAYITRLHKMLAHVDLLKLSDEDLAWLYPDNTQQDAFEKLSNQSNASMLVLTKGGDGAIARIGNLTIEVPAHPVRELKDTVGAGDTFTASLLTWLYKHDKFYKDNILALSENELRSCVSRAAKAAALNCEQVGCNPPTSAEILEG